MCRLDLEWVCSVDVKPLLVIDDWQIRVLNAHATNVL